MPQGRTPVIDYVGVGPIPAVWRQFRESMSELGWIEGQTFEADDGVSANREDLVPIAMRQARRPVDVFAAFGNPGVQAAMQASSSIPIVMFGLQSDPVEAGIVASLAKPGGNVTGITQVGPLLSAKRMELLKAVVPVCRRVGLMTTPGNGSRAFLIRENEKAAQQLGLELRIFDVDSPAEITSAFDTAQSWSADGLLVAPDARLGTMMSTVIEQALARRITALYGTSNYIRDGALMGFGPSQAEQN